MRLLDDERGQSVQVGAAILLGFVVLTIALYQANVVPSQNADVEANHQDRVTEQLQDLRTSMLTVGADGPPRSQSIALGTNYPERTIFINPSKPNGFLRTSEQRQLQLSNVRALGNAETTDYWDGATDRSYDTQSLRYSVGYAEHQAPDRTVLEHTLLYDVFDDETVTESDQLLLQDDSLQVITVRGNLSEQGTSGRTVDVRPLSQSQRTLSVEGDGRPITLQLPTDAPTLWEDQLEAEGHTVTNVGSDSVTVELDRSREPYELTMASVGVADAAAGTPAERAAYVTLVDREAPTATVEVRDRFNNPVRNFDVAANGAVSASGDGSLRRNRTDSDGRLYLENVTDGDSVTVDIFDGSPADETVSFTVVGPSGGSGDGDYGLSWQDPSGQPGAESPCSETDCTWNASASSTFPLTANTSPSLNGVSVDFALDPEGVVNLSENQGQTTGGGLIDTTLQNASANQTVSVYALSSAGNDRINVTVENVGGSGPGDTTSPTISNFQATNPSGQTVEVSFDSDEDLSTIAVDVTDGSGTTVTTLTEGDFSGSGTGTYTATYSASGYGTYTATLQTATDAAGNDGASGESDSVTIDDTPPSITNAIIADDTDGNGLVTDGDNVSVRADVDDFESGVSSVTADATAFGAGTITLTDGDGDGTYEGTFPVGSSGTAMSGNQSVVVSATDGAGNVNSQGTNELRIETGAPTISNFTATNPSGRDINVSFDSSEDLTDIAVELTDESGSLVTTLTEADFSGSGSGTYSATYTAATDGNYTATLTTAGDAAGNDGATGQNDSVIIDTTPPSVNVTSPTTGEVLQGGSPYAIQWTASDAGSGVASNSIGLAYSTDGGSTWTTIATGEANIGSYDWSVPAIDTNNAVVRANATDGAGNTGDGASGTFSVDSTAPTVSNFQATNPSGFDLNVSFTSDEDLSTIAVDVTDSNGNLVTTLTEGDFTGSGSGTYAAIHTVTDGDTYTATLRNASDEAGNDGASGQTDSAVVGALAYNGDALAMDGPDSDSIPGGVALSFENQYGETVEIQSVGVSTSGAARLNDRISPNDQPRYTELYVAADQNSGWVDVNGGVDLPNTFDVDADGFTNDGNPLASAATNFTTSLFEFTDAGNTPVAMGGEQVTVDVTYVVGGETRTQQFTVTVSSGPDAESVVQYVSGSASANRGQGGVDYQLENTGPTTVSIEQVSVTTSDNQAEGIFEENPGTGVTSSEMYFDAGTDTGYYDSFGSEYPLGSTVTLDDPVTIRSGSTVDGSFSYFGRFPGGSGNWNARSQSGETIDVTVTFADGSTGTYTITVP